MTASTSRLRRTGAALAAATAALALAACGSSGGSGSTAASTSKPAAAKPAAAVTVDFGEYFYRPKLVTVHVGQPVRFVNVGKIAHTVADSSASGTVRSALIQPRPLNHGQSQIVTFKHAGTVNYLCTFHPTLMRGVITVEP